jgi:hypothetical protein
MSDHTNPSQPPGSTGISGDPGVLNVMLVLLLGIVIVVLLIVLVQAGYLLLQQGEDMRKIIAPPDEALGALRASEAERLENVGWVERTGPAEGKVRIPLERALAGFLEEHGKEEGR